MLIIPEIGVSAKIIEGEDSNALLKGVWHIPYTGNPKNGNMVIAGHRFEYLPPNNTTFYNLDKLKVGEKIFVYWQREEYIYNISKIFIVSPNDLYIQNYTIKPTITLYTCTPLFNAQKRLVVVGNIET